MGPPQLIWPAASIGVVCKDSFNLPSILTGEILSSEEVKEGEYPSQMRDLLKAVPPSILREVYDDILRDEDEIQKGPSRKDLVPALVAYIMQVSWCASR